MTQTVVLALTSDELLALVKLSLVNMESLVDTVTSQHGEDVLVSLKSKLEAATNQACSSDIDRGMFESDVSEVIRSVTEGTEFEDIDVVL